MNAARLHKVTATSKIGDGLMESQVALLPDGVSWSTQHNGCFKLLFSWNKQEKFLPDVQ